MSTVFVIDGKEYDVVKKGVSQARQVAQASAWLSRYGTQAFKSLAERDTSSMAGLELAIAVLGVLDEAALLDLFQLTFGCTRDVAEREFDFSLVIDGLVALYNGSPTLKKLADRFFSVAPSADSVDISSTPSDQPMAG